MQSGPTLDSRRIAALYDEGYYHGANSGYPAAGYESEHASWRHWVEHLAGARGPGARWLDLGCAYGYLVAEARAGGFASVGVDVSAYALGRTRTDTPAAAGRLARGLLETLPFADATFDVVSAFDVLEHLLEPEPALREIQRVLRPGGLLVGATPDPLFFDRHEATHVSEHPPSYWVDRLLALGFAVDFRFFQAPYNLELLATRGERGRLLPAARLRTDGFGADADLGAVTGPAADRVALRLRSGWCGAGGDKPSSVRWVGAGEALAYLLLAGREPARAGVRLAARAADGAAEIALALDDHRLGRFALDGEWRMLAPPAIPLAAGGHHLRLSATAAVFVRALEVAASSAGRDDLLARLPFDMYQRYDQCRAVVAQLGAPSASILDVGGALAGDGGHLATTGDFFPALPPPLTIDLRRVDHPDHRRLADGRLPFPDASFDVVLCQDVLEHLGAGDRAALQGELARVSRRFVLLAAPFATEGVAAADELLFEMIRARHGYAHAFLQEHLEHGHPDLAATVAHWQASGATAVVLPNGYLPYWSLMQVANLQLAESTTGDAYATAQARYSGHVFDWCEPAYRHLLVIDRSGRSEWCDAVRALVAGGAAARRAQDATALSAVLDLVVAATAARSGAAAVPGVAAKARVDGAADEPRVAGAGGDGGPAAAERSRLLALARVAARVWAHPATRLYGRVRRVWRAVVGGRA